MKRILSLILALCLMLPGLALAQSVDDMLIKGNDFVAGGDYASAAISYDIAQKLAPNDVRVMAAQACLKALQGDHDGALAAIDAALALEPANGELYLVKAEVLKQAGNTAEAELALAYARVCGAETPDTPAAPAAPVIEKDEKLTRLMTAKNSGIDAVTVDLTGFTGSCSAAYYLANAGDVSGARKSADGLRVHLGQLTAGDVEAYQPLAVSPSGKVMLYNGNGMLFAVRDGEVIALTPNYAKSAGDGGKDAQITLKAYERFGQFFELDSVSWSPDERYFTLTFPRVVTTQMRFFDLIICDTLTGDIYLPEVTPSKMNQEGAQAVLAAAFDATGDYVYYLAFGSLGVGRCALKRLEMATGKTELLYGRKDLFMYQPRLVVSADGTVRAVSDQNNVTLKAAVLTFREVNGQWTCEERQATLPVRSQRLERYLYSEKSGHELILCRGMITASETQTVPVYYLTLNGEAIMLDSGATHAEKVPLTEELFNPKTYRYMNIVSAEISPDGHFALISAGALGGHSNCPILLDLDTLEFKLLTRPISLMRTLQQIAWNGGRMVLLMKDGNALFDWTE